MKRSLLAAVLAAALVPGALAACGGPAASSNQPTAVAEPVKSGDTVVAEAKVVPIRSAALSFQTDGTVAEVPVKEGDTVAAGQVLARLDNAAQAAEVARAEAQLKGAEARLQDLTDGPRQEDVAAAEAQLREAQAGLRQTVAGVSPADITAAQSQIQAAQAQLARLQQGPKNADLRAAQAQLAQAQSGLSGQRDQLSAGKTQSELALAQAAEQLVQAQTTYSTAKYQWEYVQEKGVDPLNPTTVDAKTGRKKGNELNDFQRQQYHDAFVQAEAALRTAEQGVKQAQVARDNAHAVEISGLQTAQEGVSGAQANLDRVRSGIDTDQLAAAKAQLASAQASLGKLRGPQREAQLASAQAAVDGAQANLSRVKAPPQPSELTASEAEVASAKAALDSARVALSRTELKAPFAGVVEALDAKPNEYVTPGTAMAQLADVSEWQIETTDLTELSVVQVREGDPVSITFDAIPGLDLPGKVVRLKGFGENRQGDIVYKVIVRPDQHDERLRWNMTASVAISTQ